MERGHGCKMNNEGPERGKGAQKGWREVTKEVKVEKRVRRSQEGGGRVRQGKEGTVREASGINM